MRTLAAAQGVDDVDGHALAGFIEAEGSFSITANNGGRSWLCGMSLNQRADDADVLCDIVRVTGLGRLYAVPARRTSRPQVVWSVASKLECRELARLFAVATRCAVESAASSRCGRRRWIGGRSPCTGPPVRPMASYAPLPPIFFSFASLRRYVRPSAPRGRRRGPASRPADRRIVSVPLGGFFTGRGSFSLRGQRP